MFLLVLTLITLFLCWGSFLNVLSYRLIHGYSIFLPRSFCPNCKTKLIFWDLIPVISWLLLKTKCRYCKHKISYLYPLIESLTAIIFTFSYFIIPPNLWLTTFIFFSALIVTIRTDLETMLISRAVTTWLIPLAFFLSFLKKGFIYLPESLIGAALSYILLWLVAKIFYLLKKQEGMGEGDFELLAMIGSFIGFEGSIFSVTIGSLIGSIIGIYYHFKFGIFKAIKIPFGPWLSIGAIIYVILSFSQVLQNFFIIKKF